MEFLLQRGQAKCSRRHCMFHRVQWSVPSCCIKLEISGKGFCFVLFGLDESSCPWSCNDFCDLTKL